MKYILHHSRYHYADNPKVVEAIKKSYPNARFIEEIALDNGRGGHTDYPGVVLYDENPPNGYCNFFALFDEPVRGWIVCGQPNFDPVVDAIFEPTSTGGYLTISRFGHDMVYSPQGSFIDGGRSYTRVGGPTIPEIVRLNLLTRTFERNGDMYDIEPR